MEDFTNGTILSRLPKIITKSHVPATLSKGEKKKCKSCAHFGKGNACCWCRHPKNEKCVAPMDTACNLYERKKK